MSFRQILDLVPWKARAVFVLVFSLGVQSSAEMKREGDVSRDMTIQYASQRFDDCGNPFGGLVRQVKIINGESRTPTKNDPSGGFIVSANFDLGGRGTITGDGTIVVTAAHTIINQKYGGIHKDMASGNGKVYFFPSKSRKIEDRVEIDLEQSVFGCRKSFRDPLPAEILRDPIKLRECDTAILVLKEDIVWGSRHSGKGIEALSFADNLTKTSFNEALRSGKTSLTTAQPGTVDVLYTETSCQEPDRVYPKTYSGLLNEHGCDAQPGDSGTSFKKPCGIDSNYTCLAGIHTGEITEDEAPRAGSLSSSGVNANRGIVFGGKFREDFLRVYKRQKAIKDQRKNTI